MTLTALRFVLALLSCWFALTVAAAEPPAIAKREITHLLDYLEHSGCEFSRNGTWYPTPEARTHLEKKYAYLADKDMIATAEDFIDRGATESSMSGKPYAVRCAGSEAIPSRQWLREELDRYRSSHPTP